MPRSLPKRECVYLPEILPTNLPPQASTKLNHKKTFSKTEQFICFNYFMILILVCLLLYHDIAIRKFLHTFFSAVLLWKGRERLMALQEGDGWYFITITKLLKPPSILHTHFTFILNFVHSPPSFSSFIWKFPPFFSSFIFFSLTFSLLRKVKN